MKTVSRCNQTEKTVEVTGVEPGSGNGPLRTSTCVFRVYIYPYAHPRTGPCKGSHPKNLMPVPTAQVPSKGVWHLDWASILAPYAAKNFTVTLAVFARRGALLAPQILLPAPWAVHS